MDIIEMDPWKRFNFEDENERMKMPGFSWFNTGQFILNFQIQYFIQVFPWGKSQKK